MRESFLYYITIGLIVDKKSNWVDRWIGVLFSLSLLIVASCILALTYYFVDSSFVEQRQGTMVVVKKRVDSAHSVTTYTYVNNSPIPITTSYPDIYVLETKVEGKSAEYLVEKGYYNNTKLNDTLKGKYVKGRISGKLYIKSLDNE